MFDTEAIIKNNSRAQTFYRWSLIRIMKCCYKKATTLLLKQDIKVFKSVRKDIGPKKDGNKKISTIVPWIERFYGDLIFKCFTINTSFLNLQLVILVTTC